MKFKSQRFIYGQSMKMQKIGFILVFSFLNLICCDKLLMIQQVFRHGARYPLYLQKIDNSIIAAQLNSKGELTSQGKNMHYLLGKILYQKYWEQLFSGTPYINQYNQSQFYIKSTDVNRTIESAQSQLYGWLENLPKLKLGPQNYEYSLPAWEEQSIYLEPQTNQSWYVFKEGPSFHPIPIHVQKLGANLYNQGDFLRKFDQSACPNQRYWKQQNINSEQVLQITKNAQIASALTALSKEVQQQVKIQDVDKWIDSYTCLKYLGYNTLPIFQSEQYGKAIAFMQTYTMYQALFSQKDQIKAIGTDFVKQIVKNIEGKVNNTYTPKVVLYSAHDTTVAMVLSIFQFVSPKCIADNFFNKTNNNEQCFWKFPKYASNIIFEVWQNSHKEYYIKILYNGKPRKIPICGQKIQCPLQQFKNWAEQFMVSDVSGACGFYQEEKHLYAVIFIFLCLLVILIMFILYDKNKTKIESVVEMKQYNPHVQQKIQSS